MRKIIFSIGIAALLNVFAHAQEPQQDTSLLRIWEAGLPYITQYTPEDYKAAAQNWCFIQDNKGTMYVGNSAGILEFDGVSWRLIKLTSGGRVASMAKRSDGTLFVGGSRDFGYLMPDSLGQVQFCSLLPQLDTAFRDFSDVWHTYAVQDTIYFITAKYIFRWANNSFKVLFPNNIFGFGFLVNDKIYVDDRGTGIMQITGDSLSLIPDGFKFSEGGVTAMSSHGQNDILITHALEGAYLYDYNKIVPFKNKLIRNTTTYGTISLPNGDLLIYSIGGGAYIVDAEGNFRQEFNKSRGLTSDVIYGAYVDRNGRLWLACDNGINSVEISSSLRLFNDLNGLVASAQNTLSTSHGFYVSTNDGLFYFSKDGLDFQRIAGISNMTRHLIPIKDGVLVGNLDALYWVDNKNQSHVIQFGGDSYNILLKSAIDSAKVYVAGNSGNIYELALSKKDWKLGKPILGIDGNIVQIVENPDASLWLNTQYNGVYKVDGLVSKTDPSLKKDDKITHFDTQGGLPALSNNYLCQADDQLYLSTQAGMYLFDSAGQKFEPDTLLMNQINLKNMSAGPVVASEDGVWMAVKSDFQNKVYRSKNGLVKEMIASRRFSDFEIYSIYDSSTGIVFFSGPKGIIAYNARLAQNDKVSFPIQIRRVLLKNDSLIFAGHIGKAQEKTIALPFQNSGIRFAYALPSYDKPEANQYQYFLEGFDEDWSAWTAETQRDFTNLPEGDYRFRVRGQNVYGQISEEAVYAFTVLPPWYRTWWAYLLYALVFIGFVGWIVRWRSAKLRQEKEALENIVKERTQQLEQQAEQLKEIDQMKSRLFANISHEFRTPLTLIKGPVAKLVQTRKENLRLSDAQMIDRNADRLLRLVNQLLDLSKLDAGNLELEPETGDIYQFLRALAAAFSSHAEQRGMTYRIAIPQDALHTSFDHDKLEKIVYNLLSNAFKFTPDGGVVTIKVSYSNAQLELKVKDSGRGIVPEQLPHIFDRFYQTDSSATREQEGTGIGLALTKELVTLMGGNISVQSEPGAGTAFTVTLPLTAMAITEQEVAEKEIFTLHAFEENIVPEKEMPVADGKRKQEVSMVLIVEDNADMRSFIKTQLYEDYEILEAAHGKAGLDIAQQEIPDLIITDLMMPQMDGMELCQQLKTDERTSHIPVIMLTAKAGQEHKIEGLETGADDYLTKPFDRQELQVRVKNLITQRQQLRERFSREVILEPRQIAITSLDEQFLQKVMDLLEKNLSDTAFSMPEMQDALAMSKTQLYRKIKALTDQSPGEFIRNYRLKRAAQILSHQGDNVTQVAYAVGFNNLSYFAKCFKELYGVAPSAYTGQPLS